MLLLEESTSYKTGYWLGSFIGAAWPYVLAALIIYVIFRIVRNKSGVNSGR
ncbi:MAG: hypothetical protein WAZ98_14395 [Cyclobacteriaceae bacterium]